MKKNIILVAGYEYHNGRTNFAIIAKRRARFLLHDNREWRTDPNLNFVLFDIRFGRIERGTLNEGRIDWQLENDDFDAVDDDIHYTSDRRFIQADTNVISITDVYAYIQNIGRLESGTILEFSIFGHGWRGGPVLLNTYERDAYKSGGDRSSYRDPWDRDGRKKDTNVSNMPFKQWYNYKEAFSSEAIIWVWGCAASRMYKRVIQKTLASTEFRNKRYGSHVDTDTFSLSFSRSFANDYFSYDPLFFFRSRTAAKVTERRFTRTLLEIKNFLIRGMVHTYAAQMAYNANIKIYAALPGTGADYERNAASSINVMVVPKVGRVYGYSFNQILRFYKTYLNCSEDLEQRGYALFDPEIIRAWKGK